MDDPQSRKSRLKRINLSEMICEQNPPLMEGNGGIETMALGSDLGTKDPTVSEVNGAETTQHNPPHMDNKTPVTLESLSDKIDQILDYNQQK